MMKRKQYESVTLEDLPRPEDEQFRMRRLTVYNWGTFSSIHTVPIAEDGMLLIGPSGAGKSTLLDAISVMIVPPRLLHMNAAAEEGDRKRTDRSVTSYVRGAWADRGDVESREVTKQYLRPAGTVSAIALEYGNRLGRTVTLVRIFWITGVSVGSNLNDHLLVVDGEFDMEALSDFDGDRRKLRRMLDGDHIRHYEAFAPYEEHWRRVMGIDDPGALELLHRTQSTKNLGDLNRFLREFMLKEPATFELADRLVDEFGELDEAHRAVVTAREQIEVLLPARAAHEEHVLTSAKIAANEALANARIPFGHHLRLGLIETEIARLSRKITSERDLVQVVDGKRSAVDDEIRGLQRRHSEEGGDTIIELETRRSGLATQERSRSVERAKTEALCAALEWSTPGTPEAFALLRQRATDVAAAAESAETTGLAERDALTIAQHGLGAELKAARDEVLALEQSSSNIPGPLQRLRDRMVRELNVPSTDLVFVGELIQVRKEHLDWAPAAERLLASFGKDLLVDARHQRQLAAWVDRTHLGLRLVYHAVTPRSGGASREPRTRDSIVNKLEFKPSEFSAWLSRQVVDRFDYQCVRSVAELLAGDMRITMEGQIRHAGGRMEKDDRHDIRDRQRWVLGFDSKDKLEAWRATERTLLQRMAEAERQLRELESDRQALIKQRVVAAQLAAVEWDAIDVDTILLQISAIDGQLRDLKLGNHVLNDINGQLLAAQERKKKLDDDAADHRQAIKRMVESSEKLEDERVHARAGASALAPAQQRAWEEKLPVAFSPTLASLSEELMAVERALHQESNELRTRTGELAQTVTTAFSRYIERWPVDGASLLPVMSAAPDFLAILERLEVDGLPAHEERFRTLLAQQSTQRLAELTTMLNDERSQIATRLEDVNEGLRTVPYNPGSYLQIRPVDLNLPDVSGFRKSVGLVFAGQRAEEDAEAMEARFAALRGIVMDLKSDAPDKVRWRTRVLDVRQHVEFAAEELEMGTDRQLELAKGSAGKSGGQRQKLTATCLAAALRFKLGGTDGSVPSYAAVVLDEAFTKTDDEFTKTCMRIFTELGFQMIVATPIKSVMTLEEFVGGAAFVTISQRRTSSLLNIEYDHDTRRLRLSDEDRAGGGDDAHA